MAVDRFGRIGRWALWFSPVVIVPGLLALRPWVENDLIAVAIAIFATGYSIFVAERVNRRLDEVQIAGQRIAQTRGMTIGIFAAPLVMILRTPSPQARRTRRSRSGWSSATRSSSCCRGWACSSSPSGGNNALGGAHDMQADIDMKNRIRVLRAEKRWSQAELAERVRVSRNSINAIENGRFDPSLPLAFRIAAAFDLSVEEVFDKTDA